MPISSLPRRLRRIPRRLALLLGVGATVAALAGCGAQATATSGATRTVTDVDGTTMKVPVHPQRVVALSEPTLDDALALGITPVGTITGRGQSTAPHYLGKQAADLPILGAVAQPDYERIAAARPDLILVDGTSINNNADALRILRRIAPTYDAGLAGGDWRTNLTHAADALNATAKASAVIAAYDKQAAAARKELAGRYAGKTFSIVRWQGGSASLILEELPAGIALTDLGLARPKDQDRRGRGHSEPVSLENLQQIDADYLFFGTLGGSSVGNAQAGGAADSSAADQALHEAEQVPGFTQLTAYKDKHIIPVDGSLWTSTGGPILMDRIVDSVVAALS
jgi:iron complex transport system substrate-binding protein